MNITLLIAVMHFNIQELLRSILQWISDLGPWGPITFLGLYILATILFIPGAILTLGAGVVFGAIAGSIYVFIGATLGATIAFLAARYLVRGHISRQIENHPKFQAIDQAVAREGFKIVLLTRLSPIFPFNLLNYVFGITQVSLKNYFLGSVGMIPGTMMYVYLGSLVGNLAMIGTKEQPTSPTAEAVKWGMRVIGLIATVAVTLYVTHFARKALAKRVS
jgi:uncharacterized membrane protein YdjX (TVP38/TMEM64 family)